jgi:hypothetical protein
MVQPDVFDVSYLWLEREGGRRQQLEEFVDELVQFWDHYFKDHGLPQYAEEISPKGRKHCPCGKELIDINSRGEILTGCSRCNVWWQPNKPPVRLSEEDLLALHTRGAERLQKGPEAEPSGDYEY